MLAQVVGSSIYAFGVMVGSFLSRHRARWCGRAHGSHGDRSSAAPRVNALAAALARGRHLGGGGLLWCWRA
jgi:hypothetical protein